MNTIKLERNKGFEFKLEPNFLEERRITQEMATILGGWDKLAELDNAIAENYRKHIEFNKNKFGSEYESKYNRYIELLKTDLTSEELQKLRQELNNNKYYNTYLSLLQERTLVQQYATLLVLCVSKPEGFDFEKQSEDKILELYAEYEELKKKQMKELQD